MRALQRAVALAEMDDIALPVAEELHLDVARPVEIALEIDGVVTERGLGKCSNIADYRVQKRGGKGIITVNRTEKTGDVVALMEVLPADEIMIITKHGVIIRSSVSQVRVTGRIAQGVKLVNLDEGDLVTAVARVVPEEEGEGTENGVPGTETEQVEALTDE